MANKLDQRRARLAKAVFYGILDTSYLAGRPVRQVCEGLLSAGVDLIQLRAKKESPAQIQAMAEEVRDLIQAAGVLFIMNDWADLARAVEADGVHVGQDDESLNAVREVLAPDQLVGKSTHSLEQAQAASQEGADYIGVGPLFATPTKPDYTPVGLPLVAAVRASVQIPQFCIGGIKLENLDQVIAAGARRVVIVSGLLQAVDMKAYGHLVRKKLALVSSSS